MDNKIPSLNKSARTAGVLYLCFIILGIYSLKFVQSQTMVSGNAVATSKNILDHEFLFRSGILSSIIAYFIFLPLVLSFYQLLKDVNGYLAKLMVLSVIVQIPISFLLDLFNFASFLILKGEVLKKLSFAQRLDLFWLFIRLHRNGIALLEIYWGIWLIPLGLLVYRSGFISWIIGVLLIAGGIAYIADSTTFLLFPNAGDFVSKFINVASLAEILIMLWLLIVGVRAKKPELAIN
jgi:hypothetical protein